MHLLLVVATYLEISPFLEKTKAQKISENFFQADFNQMHIDILITGIGMVSTTYHLTKLFSLEKATYDCVLNVGIAGSFKPEIPLGEVVNVISDCFSDLGVEDGEAFIPFFQTGLLSKNEFPFTEGWLENKTSFPFGEGLKKVKAITVNTVHGHESSIEKVKELFNPDVESMEGAAFFYCCLQENIPCIQIRSISNYVEKRNKKNWKMELAIENLNEKLLGFIKE